MGKEIHIRFDHDISEDELEMLRNKIRLVLAGAAVEEPEVEGQSSDPWGGGDVGFVPD